MQSWCIRRVQGTFSRLANWGLCCPVVSAGRLARLSVVRPDLAREYDAARNTVSVNSVRDWSPNVVWWKCASCGASWQASVLFRMRSKDAFCPKCSQKGGRLPVPPKQSLAETHPQLASMWDQEANAAAGPLTPKDVTAASYAIAFWRNPISPNETFARSIAAFVQDQLPPTLQRRLRAASRLEYVNSLREKMDYPPLTIDISLLGSTSPTPNDPLDSASSEKAFEKLWEKTFNRKIRAIETCGIRDELAMLTLAKPNSRSDQKNVPPAPVVCAEDAVLSFLDWSFLDMEDVVPLEDTEEPKS